jgi:hypothetical protein
MPKLRFRSIPIFLAILALLYLWNDRITSQNDVPNTKTHVCISIVYENITTELETIRQLNTTKEMFQYAKENITTMNQQQLHLFINQAYAKKFNYSLLISDLRDINNTFTKRHRSWTRLLYVSELQQKQPHCEWIASMDSTSYLWMEEHSIHFHQWFSTTGLHEATLNFDAFHLEKRKRLGFYDWNEQPYWFIVGMHGVDQHPPIGSYRRAGNLEVDYVDSTVFFVRNNEKGKRLMEDWYFEPNLNPGNYRAIYDDHANSTSREQRVLNNVILPLQENGVMLLSFKDMLLPWGRMIRKIVDPVIQAEEIQKSILRLLEINRNA